KSSINPKAFSAITTAAKQPASLLSGTLIGCSKISAKICVHNSGGDVFRWVRDQIFDEELNFDEITEIAAQIEAGAEGVLFHP
uniref:hypothetical protein n=1 Tax=Lactococcus petauri TaxID=1940789 RepID=UPI0023EAE306